MKSLLIRLLIAKTLVMFQYQNSSGMIDMQDAYWRQLEQPKILLTRHSDKADLLSKFNSHILAVIFMDNWQWSSQQWQHLAMTMKKRSNLDLILITNKQINSTKFKIQRDFLTQCWQKAMARILITSFEKPQNIYIMHRFPQVTINKTSVSLYLQKRGEKLNAQGYPLRVSAGSNPPHALVYYNATGQLIVHGTAPWTIQLFAQYYNLTIKWVLMPNFSDYGLSDCVRHLLRKQIDLCADFMPSNATLFTVTKPLQVVPLLLNVPYAQTVAKYKYLIIPFKKTLWLAIIATFIFLTFTLSFIHRFRFGKWNMGEYLLKSYGVFLSVPYGLPQWHGIEKLMGYGLLSAVGVIICNSYSTYLSTILTTNVYKQIESLEELKRRGIKILLNDMDKEILELFNMYKKVSDIAITMDVPTYRRIRDSLDPSNAYAMATEKADFYLYQQKYLQRPLLYKVKHSLGDLYAGFPMYLNWPLEGVLNEFYTIVTEFGLPIHWDEKSREESIALGLIKFLRTTSPAIRPLNISFFNVPAVLIAAGYLSGIICFAIEIVTKMLRKKIK